ncbi:hypothetical protein NT6N_07100 [Oceaniferula spumae]|uniref:Uncharacterized protein n=1 Tax=Oceaniferula spumae TaxID=2979115 RepID=A0AAT9FI99_9BACT
MNSADQINPAEQVERIREILVGRDIELVNNRIESLEKNLQSQSSEANREVTAKLAKAEEQYAASQQNIQSITNHIRQQLQQEASTRGQQINDLASKIDAAAKRMEQTSQQLVNIENKHNEGISKKLESLSSEMASRIDAHSRQIMEHMHREIQQWKNRMDGQITTLAEEKLDRQELTTRLARIASAAMGDAVPPSTPRPKPSGMGGTLGTAMGNLGSPLESSSEGNYTPPAQEPPNLSSLDVFAMPTDDFTS